MKKSKPYYTSSELAEYLNLSKSTLKRLRDRKEIPFYKFSNEYRYDYYEIEKWKRARKVA